MADHIDFEALVAYWLGEAPASESEKIEEHFFACAACTGRLESLAALSEGVRAAVRGGRVGLFVSRGFVDALVQAGLRLRQYSLEAGGSVNCTLLAEEDAVVSHVRAPLAGVKRLDALRRVSVAGVDGPEERVVDVPFDPAADEVLFVVTPARLKRMPSHTVHLQLVAVDEAGERPLGDYTFLHTAG